MTALVSLPKAMTESDWTAWVIDAAMLNGWKVHHGRPARAANGWRTPVQGHVGLPDLVLARAGEVLLAELKTNRGQLRTEQREWLDQLGDHGCVWRPRDAGEVLARLAKRGQP